MTAAMSSTSRGSGDWLLLYTALLLSATGAVTGQYQPGYRDTQGYLDFVTGACPNYQTSVDFTWNYVNQLEASEEGFILALSTGNMDVCQRLKFMEDNKFKFSFIDVANFPRNYVSSYYTSLANLTKPAQIKLNMLPGLLGADSTGRLSYRPLLADADKLVVAACWQQGYFKREQLHVFVPYPSTASAAEIKADLIVKRVDGAEYLEEMDQNCVPGVRQAPRPIPLRFYNLVLAIDDVSTTRASFRSGGTVSPALQYYRNFNFQEPKGPNLALPNPSFQQQVAPEHQPAGSVDQAAGAANRLTGPVYPLAGAVYHPVSAVYQPSAAVYQPSSAVYQPSSAVYHPASAVYQPSAAVYQHPAVGVYQPSVGVYQPAAPLTYFAHHGAVV